MIEYVDYITREMVQANPDKVFLFGDNLIRKGLGGQAKEMRGEPNTLGIPTKRLPSMTPDAFFSDDKFWDNVYEIYLAFQQIHNAVDNRKTIVIPSAGLGTGLAELPQRAPKTYEYLRWKLEELECIDKVLNP